jgi:protein O-mannosyl-transferase
MKNSKIIAQILKYKYLIVFVVPFLLYFNTVFYDFVKLDDIAIIENKQEVLSDIGNIKEVFITDAFLRDKGSFYRPLQTLTFMIESQIAGDSPWFYHLNNVLIHSANSVLLLWLFIVLGFNDKKGLVLTLLYSVHPLFTHAVAWVPSRNDLMLVLILVPSFIMFIKYIQTKNIKYLLFHFLLFLLSVFTKETAMAFPAVCLLYSYIYEKESNLNWASFFNKRSGLLILIWAVIILSAILARINTIGFSWTEREFGVNALLQNILIVPELLSKLLVPYNQPVLSNFDTINSIFGAVIILATIVWIILKKNKNWSMIIFGLFWFLIFIIPGSMYRHSYADYFYDYLDHRAYLPMIGIFIFLITMLPDKFFDFNKKIIAVILILILSASAALSIRQTQHYKDPIRFWFKAIKDNPYKAGFYLSLGKSLLKEDKYKTAQKVLLRGIHLMPHEKNFYLYLGEINFKLEEFEQSVKYLKQYLDIYPNDLDILKNLGGAYANMKKFKQAIQIWTESLEMVSDPNIKDDFLKNIVMVAGRTGDPVTAYNYALLLQDKPDNIADKYNAIVKYGEYLGSQGKINEAIGITNNAASLAPSQWYAYFVLGNLHLVKPDHQNAVKYWEKAVNIAPENINAYKALSYFYSEIKPNKEKKDHYDSIINRLNNK